MKRIRLQINDGYKSLSAGSQFEFDGDLIVLSGINGSGKSHLADVIRGRDRRDNNIVIGRSLKTDDLDCNPNQVLLRIFSDTSSLGDIDQTAAQLTTSHKEQVWNSYVNTKLDPNHPTNLNNRLSAQKAKAILLEKYSEQQFQNGLITHSEMMRSIPSSFAWLPDDIFQNSVLQIFYSYAKREEYLLAQKARGKELPNIGEIPWEKLNELFVNLKFDYRFRTDFQLNDSGELNYPVVLHPFKEDGSVDYQESRNLAELSDGEKAIISLAYSSIGEIDPSETKLLVLDEFDAPLNPSLTKILFEVLRIYFLNKNIAVILITHAPASIAMAPDDASFYEMFKASSVSGMVSRIQRVVREDYHDMQLALYKYFDEITDSKQRLTDL